VVRYMGSGLTRNKALEIAGITKHQFYHLPGSGSRGRQKTKSTLRVCKNGVEHVQNGKVEAQMLRIQRDPDLSCGALRMTQQLQLKGYVINKKKVASMMKSLGVQKLSKRANKRSNRTFVRQRVVNPVQPLSHLQMDIKRFWLITERRAVYVITVIDTFTREVLGKAKGYTMKATTIKELWKHIILNHLEPSGMATSDVEIEIRTDNGPQFVAQILRDFLHENGLKQVFTRPYTPEENGHIESFHGIMGRCVGDTFFVFTELEDRLNRFYTTYNCERTHTGTKGLPPIMFRRAWENDLVLTCYDERKPTRIKLRHPLYEIPGILSRKELLAKKNARSAADFKKGGEQKSSANNFWTPVNTSPSVASCTTNLI
jgi:putative transposase